MDAPTPRARKDIFLARDVSRRTLAVLFAQPGRVGQKLPHVPQWPASSAQVTSLALDENAALLPRTGLLPKEPPGCSGGL